MAPNTSTAAALRRARFLSKRMFKGLLLLGWVFLLLSLAAVAWSGRASVHIGKFYTWILGPDDSDQSSQIRARSPALALWQDYREQFEWPPPVDTMFSELAPDWTDFERMLARLAANHESPAQAILEDPEATESGELADLYLEAFRRISERLYDIVEANERLDMEFVDASEIPPVFRSEDRDSAPLPSAVRRWVRAERVRLRASERRDTLVDTFLMLVVLGAFGSLIFLARDYVREQDESIAAYVFRPMLGAFLGMAMFVIDVLLHSVISTAGMTQIRREPLYLVAFAAGLLSEQAYGIVQTRAETALREYQAVRASDGTEGS